MRGSESAATERLRQSETAPTVIRVRERLKRLDILYQHFPIYFVTACTARRKQLLATEVVHRAFKGFASLSPNYGACVGAYVIMPDHFHIFIAVDGQKLNLSNWMKSIKGTISSVLRSA